MGLFFTDNTSTVLAANVATASRIESIDIITQSGRDSEGVFFRIGNDGLDDVPVTIYSSDPSITLSFHGDTDYAVTLETTVQAGRVSSAIFVRVTANLGATEGDRKSSVVVSAHDPYAPAILTINYFVAESDKGNTQDSKFFRFAGKDTLAVIEQIEKQGEDLELIRYDPQPKPQTDITGVVPLQAFRNRNVTEWCNPNNSVVGYKARRFNTYGFVGDRELLQNLSYRDPLTLIYGDADKILLPADFEGFSPSPLNAVAFFSHLTPFADGYQRTQWILLRHDGQYALSNIREVKYFKSQILFYMADLQRIHYPGGSSRDGFLPWNQVYDEDGKVIDYVGGWSRATVGEDPYDPYCGDQKVIVQRAYLLVTYGNGSVLRIPADQDVTVVFGEKIPNEAEIYAWRQTVNGSLPDVYSLAAASFAFVTTVTTTPPTDSITAIRLEIEVTYALGLPEINVIPLHGLNLTLATAADITDAATETPYAAVNVSSLGVHTIDLPSQAVTDLKAEMATGVNRFTVGMTLTAAGVRIVGAIEGEEPHA